MKPADAIYCCTKIYHDQDTKQTWRYPCAFRWADVKGVQGISPNTGLDPDACCFVALSVEDGFWIEVPFAQFLTAWKRYLNRSSVNLSNNGDGLLLASVN